MKNSFFRQLFSYYKVIFILKLLCLLHILYFVIFKLHQVKCTSWSKVSWLFQSLELSPNFFTGEKKTKTKQNIDIEFNKEILSIFNVLSMGRFMGENCLTRTVIVELSNNVHPTCPRSLYSRIHNGIRRSVFSKIVCVIKIWSPCFPKALT